MKRELPLFSAGTLALLGSNMGSLLIPLFVGRFIDMITNKEFDQIWVLASYLLIIVAVNII